MSTLTCALVLLEMTYYLLGTPISSFHFLKVYLFVEFIKLMYSLKEILWIYRSQRIVLDVEEFKIKLGVTIYKSVVRFVDLMDMGLRLILAKTQLVPLVSLQLPALRLAPAVPLVTLLHKKQINNFNKTSSNKKI